MTARGLIARLDAYERLVRLDKPVGILLLLWPTLWGLWLAAGGLPDPLVLWVFVLGTVLTRSAGCAINDWADRRFDGAVKRTQARPLVAGEIAPWEALAVAATLALAAFAITVATLNSLAVWLAVLAAALAAIYPFTKRFLAIPQAWLGACFGLGIPMAFAALQAEVPPLAWALWAANLLWVIAYDTVYAMVDRDDDQAIGIRTSALLFGRHDVMAVYACHAGFLAGLWGVGAWQGYGWAYYAGIVAAAVLAARDLPLVRSRERDACFRAFRRAHWMGAAVLLGIVADAAT